MLKDEIRKQKIQAMKNRDEARRDILTVALGEIQLVETREGSITEERCQKILRKMIENNRDTMEKLEQKSFSSASEKLGQFFQLKHEIRVLEEFLPQLLTKEQIKEYINGVDDLQSGPENRIDTMENIGKAIGLVMKIFKENNIPVNGKDVAEVVRELRKEEREKWIIHHLVIE